MAIASFCWNVTASGIGSPHRPLSKQSRPQVHRQQARDHQQCHPYPLQHYRQRSERGSRLLKQFCFVASRIASYNAALLLRISNLGCPTLIRDVPRRVVQAEGEPLLRRGTLPGQTSDKGRAWPNCVLDLSKVTFDFD
jgi:hypothetical protein